MDVMQTLLWRIIDEKKKKISIQFSVLCPWQSGSDSCVSLLPPPERRQQRVNNMDPWSRLSLCQQFRPLLCNKRRDFKTNQSLFEQHGAAEQHRRMTLWPYLPPSSSYYLHDVPCHKAKVVLPRFMDTAACETTTTTTPPNTFERHRPRLSQVTWTSTESELMIRWTWRISMF